MTLKVLLEIEWIKTRWVRLSGSRPGGSANWMDRSELTSFICLRNVVSHIHQEKPQGFICANLNTEDK